MLLSTAQKFLMLSAFANAGKPIGSLDAIEDMEKMGVALFDDARAVYRPRALDKVLGEATDEDGLIVASRKGLSITQKGLDAIESLKPYIFQGPFPQ